MSDLSAAQAIAGVVGGLTAAERALDAVAAAGYAVVRLPVVAHKGPGETDADRFMGMARKIEGRYSVGGSSSRAALVELIRSVVAAAQAAEVSS